MRFLMSGKDRSEKPQSEHEKHNHQANYQQDRGDHPANLARVGRGPPAGIHRTGVHFFEIAVAQDPHYDSQRRTNDESENAEDENQSSAVWFHRLIGFTF